MKLELRPLIAAALLAVLLQSLATIAWAGEPEADEPAETVAQINTRFLLMDTHGRAVSDEDFAGRFQLIAFGFTSCPSVCPSTLAAMTLVLGRLGQLAAQLQPIFVTIDPERDAPEVLERYTRNFDPRIMGLTGSPELIRRTADHFKVSYSKYREPGSAPGDYTMDHSVGMYLVGPDGRFLAKFGYTTAPEDIAARIGERIEAHSASGAGRARRGGP